MIGLKHASTDRELLDALAQLVDDLDPMPVSLAARACSALGERTDALTLAPSFDSVRVEPLGTARRMAFAGLDLRLSPAAGGLDVTGTAAVGALVVARWPGGQVTAEVDAAGRFHVGRLPFGPVRFVLRGVDASGREHATPWFVA
ncbi:hypothetical protein [Saccharothrix texasensis]|uniref:Uncharacterized protein n=1 Tax=Saccharothrix texasensis TaxID=103734 RepID=A0A3N1HB31_9PSEU|nr:hypothetical protein [Saccharothrix texasensis]ROP39666.1 hypothetical protein EDD40_5063 [Saccharothrix texasensis]